MKEKIQSIETEIEILKRDITSCQNGLRKDIEYLASAKADLPQWLKASAITMLMAITGQLLASVWWASSITTNLTNIKDDVTLNTEFRVEYPKMHEESMIAINTIKLKTDHMEDEISQIKAIILESIKNNSN